MVNIWCDFHDISRDFDDGGKNANLRNWTSRRLGRESHGDGFGHRFALPCATRSNGYICAECAKFCRYAALGVDLKIQKSSSDGGACSESEKNDKEASAIGENRAAKHPPEHTAIHRAAFIHHSPRRMGAGS